MRDKLSGRDDVQLLAVDPHEKWSAKYLLKDVGFSESEVGFPLLMDPANLASAQYGVAFQMRIHTEWSNRPATFLIDRDGVLRFAKLGTSFADRPSAAKLLEQLAKLRPN